MKVAFFSSHRFDRQAFERENSRIEIMKYQLDPEQLHRELSAIPVVDRPSVIIDEIQTRPSLSLRSQAVTALTVSPAKMARTATNFSLSNGQIRSECATAIQGQRLPAEFGIG